MTVQQLLDSNVFEVLNTGYETDKTISKPYCCDLLSVAMSTAPENGIWFTVMANQNTLAVAGLTDTACIVFAQNAAPDEATLKKAVAEGITLLRTQLPVFDAALLVYGKLNA